jgi:hypothetical protein
LSEIKEDIKNLGKQILQKLTFSIKKDDAGYQAEANVDDAKVTIKKEGEKPVNFSVDYKQGKDQDSAT